MAQVHTVSSFMANPTKEGLQVMYILLTVFKYNINDGFVVPILDEHMPGTSFVRSYSTMVPTRTDPKFTHEIYTKYAKSHGHQCLVLLGISSEMVPFSMGPGEETAARIAFERYAALISLI